MPGTGGARKLRWRARGKGTRGGARAIYYYHDPSLPCSCSTSSPRTRRRILQKRSETKLRGFCLVLSRSIEKGRQNEELSYYQAAQANRGQPDHCEPEGGERLG